MPADPGNDHSSGTGTDQNNREARLHHFIAMLSEGDPSRRWKAAEALAGIQDGRSVEPLIRALSDADWRVRQKAAWALGRIGDPRAIVPLRRALVNEREGVKEIIIEAIEGIQQNR